MSQHKSAQGGKKRSFGIIKRMFLAKLCQEAEPEFFFEADFLSIDTIPVDENTGLPRVRSANYEGPQFEFLKNVFPEGCVLWPSHVDGEIEEDVFNVIRYKGEKSILRTYKIFL